MKKLILALMGSLLLAGCDSQPPTPAGEPAKAPEKPAATYDTGRVALQRLYVSARGWAADARPYRLDSQYTAGAPVSEGKAGVWRAAFASPARASVKAFVWSGLDDPSAPERGVTSSTEDSWNPRNVETQPFDMNFLKVDSDKALEVANTKGGKEILAKDPQQPVVFSLEWNARRNQLAWYISYGVSRSAAPLTVAVDATSGEFIRKVK